MRIPEPQCAAAQKVPGIMEPPHERQSCQTVRHDVELWERQKTKSRSAPKGPCVLRGAPSSVLQSQYSQ